MESAHYLIIGAGPSGLSLAYHLRADTLVLEKEDRVGGLCRSIHYQDGMFDIGGHSFHTPHPEVYELVHRLMEGQLYVQQRDARVYTHGVLIPYPFQKFFDRIPDLDVVRECEAGLAQRGDAARVQNYEAYIVAKFGPGIARHFMLPYNRKLWAHDLQDISTEWVSERVAMPQGQRERFENQGGQRKPLQADTKVAYPSYGGYEEIYRAFVPHIPALELQQEVVRVDLAGQTVTTRTGRQYHWRHLISTMPLPVLMHLVEGAPPHLIALADRLAHVSLRVEFLLAGRPLADDPQRIYVPDALPPHKIALNHNSSAHLRQRPQHAITAEVSFSLRKKIEGDSVAPRTAGFLAEVGILESPGDVVWSGHPIAEYAYPVYTHERPAIVEALKRYLAQHNVHTLGRFGEWEYINSDKCVKKGMDLARELEVEGL